VNKKHPDVLIFNHKQSEHSPLFVAVIYDVYPMIALLLESGANPNYRVSVRPCELN